MSRIGKKIINIPAGVEVTFADNNVAVKGAKGVLNQQIPSVIKVDVIDNTVSVTRINDEVFSRAQHGLMRTLINNMIIGVSEGVTKKLELHGVGYRAALQGADLVLSLGYSHPVNVKAPEGINFTVEKNTIAVSGIDKALVGEVAAKIRDWRKPEPYKGKGIRYVGEVVRRKAGKAAKA